MYVPCGRKGCGDHPLGGSKLLDFLQTDPTPRWLISSAVAAQCPHTLFGWDGLNPTEKLGLEQVPGYVLQFYQMSTQHPKPREAAFLEVEKEDDGGEAEKLKKVVLVLQM